MPFHFSFSRCTMATMQASPTLTIILAVFTLLILIAGVFLMARGGKVNEKWSNKLMIARVAMQACALLALAVLYFSMRS